MEEMPLCVFECQLLICKLLYKETKFSVNVWGNLFIEQEVNGHQ